MRIRPTTPEDLPALHAIFLEAVAGVFRPHGFEPPSPPLSIFAAQQQQILDTDSGHCHVAADRRGVAGFVSAWVRGQDWFLASLFVAPRAQGRGIGRRLLALSGVADYARRRTITDAIQPISNALYARAGLVPATPVLTFTGVPRNRAPAELTDTGAGAHGERTTLDRAAYGFDRAVDHAYWERAGRRTVWSRRGDAVAYSYTFGGDIGPVAGADPAAAADALAAELARARGPVRVRVPGSARALVETALAAELRLGPVPGLLLLSDGVPAPSALALGGYTLL